MKHFTLCLVLIASTATLQAQSVLHDHHAPAPDAVASRWATDAALRDGMARIRQSLEELHHYELGHMSAAMAADRADLIGQAIADIVAHCRLAPEADASLHAMLVPLGRAAAALKAHPEDVAQVAVMREAVADYPRRFEDAGWELGGVVPHAGH